MEGMRSKRAAATAACLIGVAIGPAGCGGERQDADEPKGDYKLEIVSASFPSAQALADRPTMRVRVRNAGSGTAPNVALTVKTRPKQPGGASAAFAQAVEDKRLADNERPVWIIDSGPTGGNTAYTNTWALGKLAPKQTRTFEFHVTAIQAGSYTIDYDAFPGLDGKARLASGSKASGSFRVKVTDTPGASRVGDDGGIIRTRQGSSADDANVSK